jgi:Emfourin
MGSVSSHTIDTEKLTKSQAAELEELLTHSDFFKLSNLRSNPSTTKGAADYYSYNITVEDEGKKHSVKRTDLAMTKELRQLINALSKVK